MKNGKELRAAFVDYFQNHPDFPHPLVESAPIVPPDDPTLLFTSAGMVQFKNLYSGAVDPLPYVRATSVQKCLRAGGKGSDLENVGKTLRHHTFFEMLGNFSFGDYFKREAIRFAWKFCTSPEFMGLNKDRIFPTIFGPSPEQLDREALQCYQEETDAVNPIIPLDESENYWGPAGDTGACGPCSELVYFMGSDEELAEVRKIALSGEEGVQKIAQRVCDEGDLFLEIWNMVFPQFDQQKDGSRPPLKNRGIDTGAGLERMTVALSRERTGRPSTPYETDLMWPIVDAASQILGIPYVKLADGGNEEQLRHRLALNAIADHARALVFCLAEGLTPGNIGRGYVIRRIQRRALRLASLLGRDDPFMKELYDPVVEAMGAAYPEIKKNPDFIRKALLQEDETFLRTRDRGMKLLAELIEQAKDRGDRKIPGEDAFRLWETYGFPVDLTLEVAEEQSISVDMEAFQEAAKAHQEKARANASKGASIDESIFEGVSRQQGATKFLGYEGVTETESEVLLLANLQNTAVEEISEGEHGIVLLAQTPFYAESGGQIGDTGLIETPSGQFRVTDTQKTTAGMILHIGYTELGKVCTRERATAAIDCDRREKIRRNHSSVHLLQAALKKIVGDHVTQAGSYVGPDYSRFDFTHTDALTRDQLRELQREVNQMILADTPVITDVLPIDEAKKKGAIAVFGEKYGAIVRVVQMGGDRSIEFCGGTHADRTSQLGHYRIISESSIASGIRRIEATAGFGALEQELTEQYELVAPLQIMMATKGPEALEQVSLLQDRVKKLEKELAKMRQEMALSNLDQHLEKAEDLPGGEKFLAVRMDGVAGNDLRTVAVNLRDKLGGKAVVVVLSVSGEKTGIVAAAGNEAQKAFPAGKVVNAIARELGGKGGGKPDLAQAGAKDTANADAVIAKAKDLVLALGN